MNRKKIIGAFIIALICIFMNFEILDASDYNGAWYRASDGVLYIFDDGMIECADKKNSVLDNTLFSGAYTFAKDKVVIFIVDDDCVGEMLELCLVRKFSGDVLCQYEDGNEIIWFCRSIEQR